MKGALQMKFIIIITIIMHAWPKLPEKPVFSRGLYGYNLQWVTNLGVIGFAIIIRLLAPLLLLFYYPHM